MEVVRLEKLEEKVEELGEGLHKLEGKVDKVDQKVDQLNATILSEISSIKTEQAYNKGKLDFLVSTKEAEIGAVKQTVNVGSNNHKTSNVGSGNTTKIAWPTSAKVAVGTGAGATLTAIFGWIAQLFQQGS